MSVIRIQFWKQSNDIFEFDNTVPNKILTSIFPKETVPSGSYFVFTRGKDVRGLNRSEILTLIGKNDNEKSAYVDILFVDSDNHDLLNPKIKVSNAIFES